ncbi:hypothetical protein PV08_08524 [Exophiala spinifera]|uniref:Uncharacterized protein n=1 Tax=Exophiala spinifera TaxID=91928 RepID=A0A0D1YE21_9EURO|nr:uncharacterized protein PV08_08524 [Exophiala spinifera]KIW13336.1 hypothetical protein PV08_08524 [Exophiala spinifera]
MSSAPLDSTGETERHANDLVDGALHLKSKAKAKVKKILNEPDHDDSIDENDIFYDAAFDPSRVLNQTSPKSQSKKSARDTIADGVKDATYIAAHPRRLIRSKVTKKAAARIGNARHPTLTVDRDRELLDAHEALDHAVSTNASTSDPRELQGEIDEASDRIRRVEEQRESLQTAWILGRHVTRVRVVRPIPRPSRPQFTSPSRFQWERYLGHLVLYYTRGFTSPYIDDFDSAPFDLEDVARIIERIAITSAPWQAFLMSVREVYMWQDPRRTGRWLALFLVLWYFQYIMAYFYFYIVYSTIRNKFQPSSVQTVRANVGRAIDREARVQAWGELIQRHGKRDWLEPFLDQIGPLIQRQLGDFADLLEVMVNFHRHEKPRLTFASVFFFSCCLAVCLCADMEFCMKVVWFVVGGGFFFSYPIATSFPKYRLLVSQFRWVFWGIPSHAELAILRLQEKAVVRDANLAEFDLHRDDDDDDDDEGDDGERTRWPMGESHAIAAVERDSGRGQLVVGRTALSWIRKTADERHWPFSELHELRKIDPDENDSMWKNLKNVHSRSSAGLEIVFLQDEITLLLHPSDRDRVFNLILAWSGQKWQSLHMERQHSHRGNLDRAIKRAFH